MEGRSIEFESVETKQDKPTPAEAKQNDDTEPTDDGFSEKRLARIAEGKTFDTKTIKTRKPTSAPASTRTTRILPAQPAVVSRKAQIIAAYKKNSGALIRLVESLYALNGANIRQEEQLLEEIKQKRRLQEELVNALILEQKNQLTENAISQEAWNLIK